MSKSAQRRSEILFALGNLVPAIVLAVGLYALPVRWWPTDVVVGAAVLVLPVTSALVFGRPALSRQALRVGGSVLLVVGLAIVAAALLSIAFLSGIHGDFGQGGMTLMALIGFLVLPYVIVYPVFELWWLDRPAQPGDRSPEVGAVSREPAPAVESSDDGGAPA